MDDTALQTCGAMLVRVPARHARSLRRAHRLATRFFALPRERKERCRRTSLLPAVGPAPVVTGHWQPTEAKEMLRVFDAIPPNLPRPLRIALGEARSVLHELLLHCMLRCCHRAGYKASLRSLRYQCRGCCPLDIFLYHNRPGCSTPNCTPHVDRGYLHAIVASPIDGLELLNRGGDEEASAWRPPHELWPHMEPCADVIILANDALAQLSCGWATEHRYHACIHRVVGSRAGTPRLSISYELRPRHPGEDDEGSKS